MSVLLDALATHAGDRPDAVAVRQRTKSTCVDTTWLELREMTERAATRAAELPQHEPVVLALDNSSVSIALLLGLLHAGRDVICVEAGSSHLADPGSVLREVPSSTTIVPDGYPDLLKTPATVVPAGDTGNVHQLTSGSVGEPKIVRHRLASIADGGAIYRNIFGYRSTDQIVVPIPLAHSFGMVGGLAAGLLAGACLLTFGSFSLVGVRQAMSAGATVLLGTPLIYRLLGRTAPTGSMLRVALSSGGPLHQETRSAAEQMLGVPVCQVYGSTETGIIACQRPGGHPWPVGSVGVAAPGVSWWIDGGQLTVRTSTIFAGYLEPDGLVPWLDPTYRTGDLARLDESDVLYLTGRKESFVNVGGRKVNPSRIERILGEHPDVVEARVYAVDGRLGEQEVHAAVVATPGTGPEGLVAFCRERLAGHEQPRLHLVTSLPRSALGKVDLGRLRTMVAQASP